MPRTKWEDLQAAQAERDPTWNTKRAQRREKIIAEYEAYKRRLPDLRKAKAMTQQDLARQLSVSQAQISRLENQTDMYLSTLAQYIEALGGELKLVAVIDGQELPISLSALSEEPDDQQVDDASAFAAG